MKTLLVVGVCLFVPSVAATTAPLKPNVILCEAAAAAQKLQAVPDQFQNARPAELDRQFLQSVKDEPANKAHKKRKANKRADHHD